MRHVSNTSSTRYHRAEPPALPRLCAAGGDAGRRATGTPASSACTWSRRGLFTDRIRLRLIAVRGRETTVPPPLGDRGGNIRIWLSALSRLRRFAIPRLSYPGTLLLDSHPLMPT